MGDFEQDIAAAEWSETHVNAVRSDGERSTVERSSEGPHSLNIVESYRAIQLDHHDLVVEKSGTHIGYRPSIQAQLGLNSARA